MKRITLIAAAVFCCVQLFAGQVQPTVSTDLFKQGDNGYHTFRIPTLVQANDGTILAFAEGRKNGGGDSGDIDLVLRRSADGGKTWGDMILVWSDGDNVCGNPAPVVDRKTGRVILLSTWNMGTDHEKEINKRTSKDTRRVFRLYSDDNGLSWSEAEDITSMVKDPQWTWYATGPCHGIQLTKGKNKGRIVIPCDHGVFMDDPTIPEAANTRSHIIYSDDGGQSWNIGGISGHGSNESTIVELKNGDLMINMRGARYADRLDKGPYRQVAISKDGGKTLGAMYAEPGLKEPVCQGTILNYTNKGKLTETLLFCNPSHDSKRVNMTIHASRDSGKTWKEAYVVAPGNTAYSDLLQLEDGSVAVFYEQGAKRPYERMTFEIIPASVFK